MVYPEKYEQPACQTCRRTSAEALWLGGHAVRAGAGSCTGLIAGGIKVDKWKRPLWTVGWHTVGCPGLATPPPLTPASVHTHCVSTRVYASRADPLLRSQVRLWEPFCPLKVTLQLSLSTGPIKTAPDRALQTCPTHRPLRPRFQPFYLRPPLRRRWDLLLSFPLQRRRHAAPSA